MATCKAHIVATASAFPGQYYPQQVLSDTFCKFLKDNDLRFDEDAVRSLFHNVKVDGRYFRFPVDTFSKPPTMERLAIEAIDTCVDMAEQNVRSVLDATGLSPRDIDQIVSVTLTPAVPSVEARLMNRVSFRPETKRMPLAGLGCMAGAAGVSRAADYLMAFPKEALVLISCELSSGLWQGSVQHDLTGMIRKLDNQPELHKEVVMAIVTAALFGDGSGAVLMVGNEHPLAAGNTVRVMDNQSNWVPDTEHIMGLDLMDAGFRNILRPEVKTFVKGGMRAVIQPLLDRAKMSRDDIGHWILHPGGPKIMDAAEQEFELSADEMLGARETLRKVGNISSATVLYMLDEVMKHSRPERDTTGLLVAMGPGFSQEAALLRW